MRAPFKISEAQIQATCSDWLALDGWRRIRTDLKHLRGLGVQEPGMADDLYIRYLYGARFEEAPCTCGVKEGCACSVVLWIEWKRARAGQGKKAIFTKAEKAKIHQEAWHAAERARGALTWIAGVEFPASIEGFQAHYRASGLMRRKI